MGTLAELVLEKTNELQQLVSSQLQQLQVESEQKLTDVQHALDRLEFRFKHRIRDFQAVAEQVEAQQNALQTLRSQLSQTQMLLDTQHENQRTFMEAVQYEVTTAQVKAAQATNEWNGNMMDFQERMIAYVKQVQDDSQGNYQQRMAIQSCVLLPWVSVGRSERYVHKAIAGHCEPREAAGCAFEPGLFS